jgi:hypothetical protein
MPAGRRNRGHRPTKQKGTTCSTFRPELFFQSGSPVHHALTYVSGGLTYVSGPGQARYMAGPSRQESRTGARRGAGGRVTLVSAVLGPGDAHPPKGSCARGAAGVKPCSSSRRIRATTGTQAGHPHRVHTESTPILCRTIRGRSPRTTTHVSPPGASLRVRRHSRLCALGTLNRGKYTLAGFPERETCRNRRRDSPGSSSEEPASVYSPGSDSSTREDVSCPWACHRREREPRLPRAVADGDAQGLLVAGGPRDA